MNKLKQLVNSLGFKKNNYGVLTPPDHGIQLASGRLQSKGLNFTIYKADGGYVIETHDYDKMSNQLYIIKNDDDLGEKISHIVTYELLRR